MMEPLWHGKKKAVPFINTVRPCVSGSPEYFTFLRMRYKVYHPTDDIHFIIMPKYRAPYHIFMRFIVILIRKNMDLSRMRSSSRLLLTESSPPGIFFSPFPASRATTQSYVFLIDSITPINDDRHPPRAPATRVARRRINHHFIHA